MCAGAGAGGLAEREHNKHHSGTGSGTGSGSGFGSDQGYGSGGNTGSTVRNPIPGSEELRYVQSLLVICLSCSKDKCLVTDKLFETCIGLHSVGCIAPASYGLLTLSQPSTASEVPSVPRADASAAWWCLFAVVIISCICSCMQVHLPLVGSSLSASVSACDS